MKQLLDADYWNSVVERIDSPFLEKNIAVYYRNEHIKLLKNWCEEFKDKNILKTDLYEEAFGVGDFLFWFLGQDAEIFGMDISYKIAKKARTNAKEFSADFKNCITSDIRNCAFKDETFDLIISNSTLDNLAYRDVAKALFELRRILKPKGILVLTLDNRDNPLYLLGYLIEKFLNTNKYFQAQCYSVREVKRLAMQSNFIIQDITAIVHIPTPFNKIALLLRKTGYRFIENFIRSFIILFSKLGNKKTKFSTGWFIALKLGKI